MSKQLTVPTDACLPLIFLHMYKAGGTSFRQYIRAQYPDAHVQRVEGNIADLEAWQQQPEDIRHGIDLLLGHQYFGNHRFLRPGATYLTILREPIDRVLSFYHYVERMPDHYLHQHGFEEGMSIVEVINSSRCVEFDNLQVRMLNPQPEYPPAFGSVSEDMFEVACENLRYIHQHGVVGIIEQLDDCLKVLQRRYGWEPSKITQANVTKSRPPVEAHDDASLNAIRELNRYDEQLYALAKEMLGAQLVGS
ncbi:MAG: hypothetical protein ACIAS6_00175 [Phycisphaerales bacterium JB060]